MHRHLHSRQPGQPMVGEIVMLEGDIEGVKNQTGSAAKYDRHQVDAGCHGGAPSHLLSAGSNNVESATPCRPSEEQSVAEGVTEQD